MFDPGNPATYVKGPLWLAVRRRKVIIGAVVAITLIVLYSVLSPLYARRAQIDLNSGRERAYHRFFGMWGYHTPLPPVFGDLSDQLQPLGPPRWESYHYSSPFDSVRVNYRAGELHSTLRHIPLSFQWAEDHAVPAPLQLRIAIAQAALAELAAGRHCLTDLDDNGGFTVCDEAGNVIGQWDPTAARQGD